MNVSRETLHNRLVKVTQSSITSDMLDKLEVYVDLIKQWQKHINLISSNDIDNIWERHIVDSAQLSFYHKEAKIWADIGAGCGFPSIILAILTPKEAVKEFRLIEKNFKKTTFLAHVNKQLDLPIKIINQDVNKLEWYDCDIITARGFSSLMTIIDSLQRIKNDQTKFIFLKGKKIQQEIDELLKKWQIDYKLYQSHTDNTGCIIDICHIERREI